MMNEFRTDSLEDLVAELQQDPEYRKADRRQKPFFDLILEMVRRRRELGYTQAEVAKIADMQQPTIARIESGKRNIELKTIIRVAEALDATVEIRLVPILHEVDIDRLVEEAFPQVTSVENISDAPADIFSTYTHTHTEEGFRVAVPF